MTNEERLEKITDCLQDLTTETRLQHERIKIQTEKLELLATSFLKASNNLSTILQGNGKLGIVSKVTVMWQTGVWLLIALATTGLGLLVKLVL